MAVSYKGSCLCGEVAFEIDSEFNSFYLCHCRYCQKDTGSAHAANLFSRPDQIRWISGQNKITTFKLPSTRHSKSFCSNCGSAVPCVEGQGTLLAVPAGSLDTTISIKPTAHIFMASKACWEDSLDAIPQFADLPK